MPYRRLPNTDKSRLRALNTALKESQRNKNKEQVLSASTVYQINLKIEEFKEALVTYNEAKSKQKSFAKVHTSLMNKGKMYISHFVQILNFAIMRGEYSKQIRKYYNLPVNSNSLPQLQNYENLKEWFEKIITGEQNRIAQGGFPFQNPSVASLNSIFEQLKETEILYRSFKKHTAICRKKINDMRPHIDELIKSVWDEIENYYRQYPALIRREKAKKYGVVYVYRKNEEKIELDDLFNLN